MLDWGCKKCQAHLFPRASTSCHQSLNTDRSSTLDWSPSLSPIRLFPQVRTALGDRLFQHDKVGDLRQWVCVSARWACIHRDEYHSPPRSTIRHRSSRHAAHECPSNRSIDTPFLLQYRSQLSTFYPHLPFLRLASSCARFKCGEPYRLSAGRQ